MTFFINSIVLNSKCFGSVKTTRKFSSRVQLAFNTIHEFHFHNKSTTGKSRRQKNRKTFLFLKLP